MDTDETPTESLVEAAQAGDRVSLESLFARYLPRVRHLVALRLGYTINDFMEFEDLVQDALLDVFRNLSKFEEQSDARFCNWLAVCVANTLKEHFRRGKAKKRAPTLPFVPFCIESFTESIIAHDEDTPGMLAEGSEMAARIERSLVEMKDEAREAIILARLCGMSYEEVARTLGLPTEAAARKAVSRALATLREKLKL